MDIFRLPSKDRILLSLYSVSSDALGRKVYAFVSISADKEVCPNELVTLLVQSIENAGRGHTNESIDLAFKSIPRWIDALVKDNQLFAERAKKCYTNNSKIYSQKILQ